MMTSRGSRLSMALATAVRVLDTTFEAPSVIGISSSRIAGGMRGRTLVMRRSSVRLNIQYRIPRMDQGSDDAPAPDCRLLVSKRENRIDPACPMRRDQTRGD